MVNPETGQISAYEELWEDMTIAAQHTALFVKNKDGTKWQARIENWQIALGRNTEGFFWACQAIKTKEHENSWKVLYATDHAKVLFLPFKNSDSFPVDGSSFEWDGDNWGVLDSVN